MYINFMYIATDKTRKINKKPSGEQEMCPHTGDYR